MGDTHCVKVVCEGAYLTPVRRHRYDEGHVIQPPNAPDPRVDACARYAVLDLGVYPDLDRVCRVMAGALGVEHVAVVLATARRCWVPAAAGWTPRDLGQRAAEQLSKAPRSPAAWAGARLPAFDALFGDGHWGAAATTPLTTPGGVQIGLLLAASAAPRVDWDRSAAQLHDGAALIMQVLEARAASAQLDRGRQERERLAGRLHQATLTARTFQAIADLTALPLDEDDSLRGAAQLTAELISADWAGVQFRPGGTPESVWPEQDGRPGPPLPTSGVPVLDAAAGWTFPDGEPGALACVDVPGRAARLAFARRGMDARWSSSDRQVLRDLTWALRHLLSFAAQASALRGLEEQLQFALRNLPMILWVTDARGALAVAEGSGLTQLGLRREQVLGRSLDDVLGGTLNVTALRAELGVGQERRQEVTLAGRVYDTHRVRLPDGGGTLGVAFDVTELVESRAQARRAQRHAETLLDLTQVMALSGSLPEVTLQALEVLLPDLPHSWMVLWFREGPLLRPLVSCGEQPEAIAQWQRRGVPLTDAFAQRLLAGAAVQLNPPDLPERLRNEGMHGALLMPVRAGETLMVLGAYRREPLAWSPVERDLLSVAARVVQVSLERRDTLAELRSAAVTDSLTGLGNRRAFEADLRAALARGPVTLVTLDVDGLKQVNDTQGHARGDELLRSVARALRNLLGPDEGAYRVGGDEFCLLLRGLPGRALPDLDAALLSVKADGFAQAGASAGSASAPLDGQDPEALWQLADERMYLEKARRRQVR